MNVVDSSAWLAYFAGEANAQHFAAAIEQPATLLVPSITLLEVFKRIAQSIFQSSNEPGEKLMEGSTVCRLTGLKAEL